MLSREGQVKLSDFGVSIRGSGDADHVAGTAGYMSPERLEGQIGSDRGDVWAFGIMLLECAKGQVSWRKICVWRIIRVNYFFSSSFVLL